MKKNQEKKNEKKNLKAVTGERTFNLSSFWNKLKCNKLSVLIGLISTYFVGKGIIELHDYIKDVDSKVKEVCLESQKLTDQYKECIEELAAFRTDHLRIVSQYILSQTKKVGPGSMGTGGTNPMVFLKQAQQDTLDLI